MKRRRVAATLLAVLSLCLAGAPAFAASARLGPDPALTPGVANKKVDAQTAPTTICTAAWAKRTHKVSQRAKRRIFKAYSLGGKAAKGYRITHLIPIEVGGANLAKNLYPVTRAEATARTAEAVAMRDAVCQGRMTLGAAQRHFAPGGLHLAAG